MYEYKALITRVIDGDTVDAQVDVGFAITVNQRFRLYGINTPETRTRDKSEKAAGIRAKEEVIRLIENKIVTIKTHGTGKFGRYLVEIFVGDMNLNEYLVEEGYAVEYMKD